MSTEVYEQFVNNNSPITFRVPTPQPNPLQRRVMASIYAQMIKADPETCMETVSVGYWNLNYYKASNGKIYLIYQYFDEIKYYENV